jgi:uncharacterized RDD family membrane protein YckC
MQHETNGQDLLADPGFDLVRAETGKRLLNYIIDLVVFYILLFGVAVIVALVAPAALQWFVDDTGGFSLVQQLLILVLYSVYMFLVEAIFKGKSLGKMVTRTRAVNADGSRISAATALSRGFSRAVPFSAFSAFGSPCNPWQDKWTHTMVIDEKQSQWNRFPIA